MPPLLVGYLIRFMNTGLRCIRERWQPNLERWICPPGAHEIAMARSVAGPWPLVVHKSGRAGHFYVNFLNLAAPHYDKSIARPRGCTQQRSSCLDKVCYRSNLSSELLKGQALCERLVRGFQTLLGSTPIVGGLIYIGIKKALGAVLHLVGYFPSACLTINC